MKVKIDPLDKLASEFIRKRSKGYCERCGRYYGWNRLQTCHFLSRRHKNTRYCEDNIVALDFGCHQHFHEEPAEFEQFMVLRLGQQRFEFLKSRMRETAKVDIEATRLYLQTKIKEMDDTQVK